jgi:nitrate reductase beta subunit
LGESGSLEWRLGTQKATAKFSPNMGGKWRICWRIFSPIRNLPEIDDYYEPFTFDYEHLQKSPEMPRRCQRRVRVRLITGKKMDKIVGGPNWEEILGGEFEHRSKITTSRTCRRKCTASLKTPS